LPTILIIAFGCLIHRQHNSSQTTQQITKGDTTFWAKTFIDK